MLLEDTDLLQVRRMPPPGLGLNTYIALLNLPRLYPTVKYLL